MSLEPSRAPTRTCRAPDAAPSTPERVCTRRLGAWLASPGLHCPDGQLISWVNPHHPGYPYPEATALWLSWAAWRCEQGLPGPAPELVASSAAWLHAQLRDHGSIGRNGTRYAFDTGLAFQALVRAARQPGLLALEPDALAPLSAGLEAFLDADRPSLPAPNGNERWSDRWTGHLVRAGALVLQAGLWLDDRATQHRARRIIARAERTPAADATYLHALCYQAEGDLLLSALGEPGGAEGVDQVAIALAHHQRPDGLLPSWTEHPEPAHLDTTAQAVRLWAATDPRRWAGRIAMAQVALARHQHPSGALPYEPTRGDLNTWVCLFTDQAVRWARHGAYPAALL